MNPKKTRNNCKFCGKECKRYNQIYCSNKCQRLFEWEKLIIKFEKAKKIIKGCVITAKKYVKYRDGIKCSICKLEKWQEKPIPLVLDHIDGNSSNWSLINLRLVCGNCDMQLPTYKGKNRGNGRFYRRQRYKEKKSY